VGDLVTLIFPHNKSLDFGRLVSKTLTVGVRLLYELIHVDATCLGLHRTGSPDSWNSRDKKKQTPRNSRIGLSVMTWSNENLHNQ
jgi:hypothetical protein